jgi:hypothetical protein
MLVQEFAVLGNRLYCTKSSPGKIITLGRDFVLTVVNDISKHFYESGFHQFMLKRRAIDHLTKSQHHQQVTSQGLELSTLTSSLEDHSADAFSLGIGS